VKVNGLVLGQGVQSWEKQVEISHEIDKMSDHAVLALPLSEIYFKQHKSRATVQAVLEEAVREAQDKYLPALKAEMGEANVDCWALVRVGLARVVLQKV
jgi:hypothetical protein